MRIYGEPLPCLPSAWLFDVLPRALRIDPPKLFNSDGDEILFHRVNFPLTEAASADAIAARLEQLADLRRGQRDVLELARRTSRQRRDGEGREKA